MFSPQLRIRILYYLHSADDLRPNGCRHYLILRKSIRDNLSSEWRQASTSRPMPVPNTGDLAYPTVGSRLFMLRFEPDLQKRTQSHFIYRKRGKCNWGSQENKTTW